MREQLVNPPKLGVDQFAAPRTIKEIGNLSADFSYLTARYYPWLPAKLLYPILSKIHPRILGASMWRATKKKIRSGGHRVICVGSIVGTVLLSVKIC